MKFSRESGSDCYSGEKKSTVDSKQLPTLQITPLLSYSFFDAFILSSVFVVSTTIVFVGVSLDERIPDHFNLGPDRRQNFSFSISCIRSSRN